MLVMLLRSKCMHVGDASQVKVYVGVDVGDASQVKVYVGVDVGDASQVKVYACW